MSLRAHRNAAKNTDRCYMSTQTVISSWPATTVGGIVICDCNESAEAYHWHALVW